MIIIKVIIGFFAAIGAYASMVAGVWILDSCDTFFGRPICRCGSGENYQGKSIIMWDPRCPKHPEPTEKMWAQEGNHGYATLEYRMERDWRWTKVDGEWIRNG